MEFLCLNFLDLLDIWKPLESWRNKHVDSIAIFGIYNGTFVTLLNVSLCLHLFLTIVLYRFMGNFSKLKGMRILDHLWLDIGLCIWLYGLRIAKINFDKVIICRNYFIKTSGLEFSSGRTRRASLCLRLMCMCKVSLLLYPLPHLTIFLKRH